MKAWQWALLGLGAIVVIVLIERSSTPKPSTALNAASGFGSFLGGFLSKISAPSGNPAFAINGGAGSAGTPTSLAGYTGDEGYTPATAKSYGSQYSAAMASTAETAAATAGSGGTTFNGGLASGPGTSSDPLGIGTLSNPGFSTGTMGADFMS